MDRKHHGKKRKYQLPAFSTFETRFLKSLLSQAVKTLECLVEGSVEFQAFLYIKCQVPCTSIICSRHVQKSWHHKSINTIDTSCQNSSIGD